VINLKKFIKFTPENQKNWKVYFLLYREKIIYIGCTKNIRKRLEYHSNYYDPFMSGQKKCYLGKKKFTSYRYIIVKDKKKAYELEKKLIKKYMPMYNNYKEYYWKPTGKIINSDRAISIKLYNLTRTKQRMICVWNKKIINYKKGEI